MPKIEQSLAQISTRKMITTMNDFKIKEVALDQGETIGWLIADALGEAAGVPSAITIMHAYKDLIGGIGDFDNKAPPNPIFLQHGFDNGRSPKTVKYLSGRKYKKWVVPSWQAPELLGLK